jgi:hypothetical protein
MIVSAWFAATSRSAASPVAPAAQNSNGAACRLSMLVSVFPMCVPSSACVPSGTSLSVGE